MRNKKKYKKGPTLSVLYLKAQYNFPQDMKNETMMVCQHIPKKKTRFSCSKTLKNDKWFNIHDDVFIFFFSLPFSSNTIRRMVW